MCVKVSVIVPVYNVELYLRECLDSLVNQTLKEIEIIAVNDGSTDSSPLILKEYEEKYNTIRVINKKNGGLSSARNAGIDVAKGEYIYYLDSDDYVEHNCLQILYKTAMESSADLVLCDGKAFYDDGRERKNFIERDYIKEGQYPGVYSGYEIFCKLLNNQDYRTQVSLQFVRRQILEDNYLRFIDGILHEDHPYAFTLMALCNKVKVLKKTLFHRRFRDGSIMSTKANKKNFLGFKRVYEEMLTFIREHDIPSEHKNTYLRYLGDIFGVTVIHLYYNLNSSERRETKGEFKKMISLTKKATWFKDKRVLAICYGYPVYGWYKKCKSLLSKEG